MSRFTYNNNETQIVHTIGLHNIYSILIELKFVYKIKVEKSNVIYTIFKRIVCVCMGVDATGGRLSAQLLF